MHVSVPARNKARQKTAKLCQHSPGEREVAQDLLAEVLVRRPESQAHFRGCRGPFTSSLGSAGSDQKAKGMGQ